jgi:phage I-like protein
VDEVAVLLDAPATTETRYQIAKLGSFHHDKYGDFDITAAEVESWKANLTKLPGHKALIDLDHRSERAPRNSEAAGWVKGIDIEGEKVMADVEWTPIGESAVGEKRYQFFSPVYGPWRDEKGNEHSDTLVSVALTNKPALTGLPTISLASEERLLTALDAQLIVDEDTILDVSQAARNQAKKENNALPDGSYPIRNVKELHSAAVLAASKHGNYEAAKTLIRRRAKELGVSLTHLPGMTSRKEADSQPAMDLTGTILKALGVEDEAAQTKILDAAKADDFDEAKLLSAVADAKPVDEPKTLDQQAKDEGKVLLDADAFKALDAGAKAGAAAAKELAQQKFNSTFDKSVRKGRMLPAHKEKMEHFYALDAESTLKLLEEAPQIVNVKPTGGTVLEAEVPVPAGVDAQGFALDQKVRTKLKELGKPIEAYQEVWEMVMAEQG